MNKSMLNTRPFVAFALVLLLGVALLFVAPLQAQADQSSAKDKYTYSVRIFAGNQGTIDGGPLLVVSDIQPGERFTFYQSNVEVKNDSRYYVRGLRESGRDNENAIAVPSFEVTRDIDLVVAYGILGQDVAYTVRYVDTDGNPLAPDDQYFGNVGDSPVIAYRYIEGYTPQAYNLTGELYDDPDRNIYTFVYEFTGEGAGPVEVIDAGEGAAGAEGVATITPAEGTIADDGTPLAGPEDVVDIRDDENPLAGALDDLLESSKILRDAWVSIIGSIALLAIALAILILMVKRRKRESSYDGRY